jgi:hypothetical protein
MTYSQHLSAFRDVQYIKTTHTSAQTTSTSANTSIVVTGSEITYTPSLGADKVIYELSFYAEMINEDAFLAGQIQHYVSGAWAKIDDAYTKNIGLDGANQVMRYFPSFRFILPAWVGARQLRFVLAPFSANMPMTLHQLTDWDGSSATDQFADTTLVVHSAG